jgi:hypothetical protein
MPTNITLSSISGSSPFNIYVCDTGYTSCIYVDTITPLDVPYVINVPVLLTSLPTVVIRVVDSNDCIINQNVTL